MRRQDERNDCALPHAPFEVDCRDGFLQMAKPPTQIVHDVCRLLLSSLCLYYNVSPTEPLQNMTAYGGSHGRIVTKFGYPSPTSPSPQPP